MHSFKIILLSSACIWLFACTKQLDQSPLSSKVSDQFLRNQTEVEEYINGAYASLQYTGTYGLYLPAAAEIPSDNTYDEVPANDGAVYGDLDQFKQISTNGLLTQIWKDSYIGIQRTNVVLNRIDAIAYQVDSVKSARKAEMKFIRALLYFNMVRLFGDVPLAITETTNPNAYFGQGRTGSDKVYAQIKKDLLEAIDSLPVATTQPGRVIKTAARTLLGKVYLTLKDYPNAGTQLDAVIQSGKHSLMTSPSQVFAIANENNKEIIFAVQFASGVNNNNEGSTLLQQFSPSATVSGAKGHNLPTKSLYALYSSSDQRKGVYVGLAATGSPFCNKYARPTTTIADGGSDFVVLRYADVLLMEAELQNEQGNTVTSAGYLNQVRTRSGLANTTAATQADLRAAIDLERRLELIGEGHRWFDLLRSGNAVAIMNAWFTANGINTTIDAHNLLMPIPQGQIDTDPAIKQNPGYN